MPNHLMTVKLPPESELSLALRAAQESGEPVVVDTSERTYMLFVAATEQARDVFADYDPRAAIAGLRALDEALAGVDRDLLLRDLAAQREQDSASRPG